MICSLKPCQALDSNVKKPKGSFYLYVGIPKGVRNGVKFKTAEDFSQFLIKEKLISTVPWDDAGAYVRFSVTFLSLNEEEERLVMDEIYRRLSDVELYFKYSHPKGGR